MKKRVAVTGMGIISAIGKNSKEFQDSLKRGQSGIGRIRKLLKSQIPVSIGAEIRDFSFEKDLSYYSSLPKDLIQKARHCTRRSPYTVQSSVLSAFEAWEMAQLHERRISPYRLGIVIAGHNLTAHYQYALWQDFQQAPEYLTPRYSLHQMDTDQVGTLSEIFTIMGEGFTAGGASASGNVGIIKGYQLIQLDIVDACMVVGVLTDLSPMELQGFYSIGAMGGKHFSDEPQKACRPFDKDHEGFIYGQGSGCLILESLESAQRRGVHLFAEILGGAITLDANQLSDPNEDGEVRAMQLALDQAGVEPNHVDYLNTHGSSSPLGDETEIKAIKRIFKEHISQLWLNSTKGLTGHCLCAAGIVESIATIIQMQEGFIHPNINLVNPIDKECRFSGSNFLSADIKIAMKNSFGFGGINSSIVLKK